jgi:ATP-binding cassette subfamily C protein
MIGMKQYLPISSMLFILLIIAILRGVLHYAEQACNHYIAFKLLAIIRDHVFKALRRLCPAKLDGQDKGNLISLITNDIELLEVFYAHTISPIFIAIITCIILLIIFMHIHIITAMIAFISYLIMGCIIPIFVDRYGRQTGLENRNRIGDFSSYILESFRGILTLKQYHSEINRKKEMLEHSLKIETLEKKMKSIESIQIVSSQLFITFSSLIMFIVSYTLYTYNQMNSYQVILSCVLLLSSFGPTLALSSLSNNLLSTLSSGRRVISILDEEEIIKEVINQPASSFEDIQINDLSFQYDDEIILNHISTTFKQNEITGIIGKSGSGKSTLLKLIMRFYDPTRGIITINEKDIKNINTSDLRNMFAYVTQETVLFHDSIYNNIRIANLNASKEDIIEACQKANIHQFIQSLPNGYDTTVSELGSSLSGGEKQRIGLARAFLSNAPCILLDEPTSNLDVLNEAMILNSLKDSHQTIILVSHRPSTMKIANNIYKMNEGRMS